MNITKNHLEHTVTLRLSEAEAMALLGCTDIYRAADEGEIDEEDTSPVFELMGELRSGVHFPRRRKAVLVVDSKMRCCMDDEGSLLRAAQGLAEPLRAAGVDLEVMPARRDDSSHYDLVPLMGRPHVFACANGRGSILARSIATDIDAPAVVLDCPGFGVEEWQDYTARAILRAME